MAEAMETPHASAKAKTYTIFALAGSTHGLAMRHAPHALARALPKGTRIAYMPGDTTLGQGQGQGQGLDHGHGPWPCNEISKVGKTSKLK